MIVKKLVSRVLCTLSCTIVAASMNGQSYMPANGLPMRDPANADGSDASHWVSEDSVETENVPIGIYVWKIEPRFGTVRPTAPDTLPHLFMNDAFTGGPTGHYNYTGNLGAPRISRIQTDDRRTTFASPFIFSTPYDFFIVQPQDLMFTNTKSPFMNITYHECGNKQNGEDRIRGLFSVNANKRLGLGFKLDYLYGRGYYDSQSTAHFNGTLFASYIGDQYQMHAMYYANHLKNAENGGIENDDYVTRPEIFATNYGTADMPTRLTKTWNKMNVNTFYLTHRYSFGFRRYRNEAGKIVNVGVPDVKGKLLGKALNLKDTTAVAPFVTDSVAGGHGKSAATLSAPDAALASDTTAHLKVEFIPVAGFVHTLRFDHNNRQFLSNLQENAANSTYFEDFYLPGDSANDRTQFYHLENTLALELREGFNRWAKSGLRLYARHDFYKYTLPDEQRHTTNYTENLFTVGAQLLKEKGHFFHYNVLGELRTSGSDWGDFNVSGGADFNMPVVGDTLRVALDGFLRNETPTFYYRHYHARNAWWDNDNLEKVFHARVGGEIRYRRTRLSVHFESLQNRIWFQEKQTPFTDANGNILARYGVGEEQTGKNVQVISATLGQDFKWGILNWENELTYQLTSDKDVLPLPAFSAYTNLYLLFRIAKVLRTEFGADLRYYTAYYAPAYSPIIGQYVNQDAIARVKTGNYPTVNVYLNFHLKHTRFYVMGSHVNYSAGSGNPFLVPHYPLNRLVLRLGVSWNFFN